MQRFLAAACFTGLVLAATNSWADNTTVAQCADSFENAQRAQKNGHFVFSKKLYRECTVSACPKALRNDCIEGQATVDRAIATVTLVVRDAVGADVPATIKIDNNPLDFEPGHAVPMDPGPHRIQYTAAGETKFQSITIAEGEKSRVVVLSLEAPKPIAAPSNATAPTPPASESSSVSPIVLPAIIGGMGVIALLAAGGAFALASGEASDRDKQKNIANDASRSDIERSTATISAKSHDESASTDQLIGIVVGVGGLVTIGVAVAIYFATKPTTKTARFSPVVTF